jgi:LysR family transcriptional regulator, flagellar master operon regulator
MNIELARTFLEIVATGSFARAADQLHLTHSTVTMRIKTLEATLNQRLLVRNKTGVTLTPSGVRFLGFAETLVRTWQLTRRQMTLASGMQGILSVGADPALWDDLLYDWVCTMRRRRPEIAIRGEGSHSEHLLRRLFQGWLDVCIVYTAQSRVGFKIEHLFDDPLVLVSTVDRGVVDWDPDFIEIDWDESYRSQVENLYHVDDKTPALTVTMGWLGLRLIAKFGGSTWIPYRLFKKHNLPCKLYLVRGAPMVTRVAHMIYSEEGLKERLPQFSPDELRESILKELELPEKGGKRAQRGRRQVVSSP